MFKVYLSGPITGCDYSGATDWRHYVKQVLDASSDGEIRSYSPMRRTDHLSKETSIADTYDTMTQSQRSLTTQDRYDTLGADVIFVNLLGTKRVSIGTAMEIAWADSKRIPIVLVMEKDGTNLHDHAMIRECASYWVGTIEEGIDVVTHLLLP